MTAPKPVLDLFRSDLKVISLGLESFGETLTGLGVPTVQVDWRPPAGGEGTLIAALDALAHRSNVDIEAANAVAIGKILKGKPMLIGVGTARDVVPGMRPDLVLHSGPPITWERMAGPMRGAVIGGLIYEGLAKDRTEAEALATSGKITFEPCHHHSVVGPMAGILTSRMPVWIVENESFGHRAYATFNEGLGKVLRYGAYGDEVQERLKWIETDLAPILARALKLHGPVDMRSMIAQVLQMGDEGHNRNRAGTSLVIRELAPHLVLLDEPREKIAKVLQFLNGNDHFFLNLSMPSCKCVVDAARDIEGSTVIIAMARNGTDFGIQISGLGDRWFTGPAGMVEGLYLPGYTADDAAPDIGDSVITETAGIGGFAMAAARGPCHREVRRWRSGRRHRLHRENVRNHAGRERGLQDPLPRLSGNSHGHRPEAGRREGHPSGDQHGNRPQGARHRHGRRRVGEAPGELLQRSAVGVCGTVFQERIDRITGFPG